MFIATFLIIVFTSQPGWDFGTRFQDDNAYGATANATELIAENISGFRSMMYFLFGLLSCILVSLYRLRHAVLHLVNRLQPIKLGALGGFLSIG
jgi:hypothetical protein